PRLGKGYARPTPHHMIADVAVRFAQPFANRKAIPLVVVTAGVVVAAHVEHRDVGDTAAAVHVETALVDALDRARIPHTAARPGVLALIDPADALVQIEELRLGDRSGVQRSETVLHADIVEG